MKTAVQWLKQQFVERGETLPSGVFQDALDMEREQLNIARVDGMNLANSGYSKQNNSMDKITEQLIRIEAKLELLIDIIKAKNEAKNSETKEVISYEEYHKRRDKMAEDMANR